MTRREFLRRSAPMVAAGLVTPWFVEAVMRRLFPPKRYWDMGGVKVIDILVCPPHPVEYIELEFVVLKEREPVVPPVRLSYQWSFREADAVPLCEQHLVDRLAAEMMEVDHDQA